MNAQELMIGRYYSAAIEFSGSASAKLLMNDAREFEMTKDKLILILQLGLESFVKPILFTEEWLKKFGWRIPQFQRHYARDQNDWHQISMIHGKWYYFVSWYQKHEIRFVHQLQNLYYALTGTELTISEKTANIESC